MNPRLWALGALSLPEFREGAGLHDYDGQIQDLSLAGVASAVAELGEGPAEPDDYDEACLAVFEDGARACYGELQLHRSNPLLHAGNLDLASYDRDYAPEEERAAARQQHLQRWPEAVDMAVGSLDRVSAPIARATIGAVEGLAGGLSPDDGDVERRALTALERLVHHLRQAIADGPAEVTLGEAALTRLMGSAEGLDVDLDQLARTADGERDRMRALLEESIGRLAPGRAAAEVVPELLADHPDADGVLAESRAITAEVIAWTEANDLVPWSDGQCLVGPAPESRRWATAMMSWAAPHEAEGPSWYHVTPPDASLPVEQQEQWLAMFSRTTLPAITVHEVAPGHFSHGRALRHAGSDVRRTLMSMSFAEGWAHYVEEVAVEEGFRADDPRFAAGVAIEALVRVTRLACAIGLHSGQMSVEDAARRFTQDAFLEGPAALSEARRGTFDPTYGRYTWGKLVIRDLREQARAAWGADFSLARFHLAMLDLGSPPLGLLGTALDRG